MPLPRKLIHVAWMAIVLGVIMEVIALLAGASAATLVRDTLQKVAWSSLVCFGVAIGAAAASHARATAMGLAGFLAAPVAFAVVRILQKAFSSASGAASSGVALVVLIALLKAAEYGSFGMITGWLSTERFEHAWPYVIAGALIGLYFGGLVTVITVVGARASALPLALNEILFPIGCALVLFASRLLAARA